jgi:hypothetical protein
MLSAQGGYVRGYQAGGVVGPNVGTPAGFDSDATLEAINKLVNTTESVREAIVNLGTAMPQPTDQGKGMQEGVVGGGATTNNITFHINVEGGGETESESSSEQTGGGGRKEKEKRERDMKALGESLEMVVLKVLLEQKRPGGILYSPKGA